LPTDLLRSFAHRPETLTVWPTHLVLITICGGARHLALKGFNFLHFAFNWQAPSGNKSMCCGVAFLGAEIACLESDCVLFTCDCVTPHL